MSMQDLEKAFSLISDHADEADFAGPKPEELVAQAENVLGLSFPPTYRRFLGELGCGDIAGEEFYGISSANFENSSIPNGIWYTLKQRKTDLPNHLILIYDLGEGTSFAIDTSQVDENGENPIVAWIPGASAPGDRLEVVAQDFGKFLLENVSDALADEN